MANIFLKSKKPAVFGPGDKESYPDAYCEAVNILEEKLKKCGAEIIVKSFKVDGDIEPVMKIENSIPISLNQSMLSCFLWFISFFSGRLYILKKEIY